ncbi:MAG: BREX-3 system P-loop-containing protein BrxF [Vicinamibacteria bacterium]
MPEPLADQIIRAIHEVATLYHRLVIVAAPSASGKTAALQEVSGRTGYRRINVNLELSHRLLDLTERQRALHVPRLLGEIAEAAPGDVVLLDNVEILFDVTLKLDPLQCLRGLARHRTVVVAWNGTLAFDGAHHPQLSYAESGHPEYRRYPASDLVVMSAVVTT